MKTKIKILLLILVLPSMVYGKNQCGIYMNLSDYEHNKLTHETGCTKKDKIHIHDFFWNMGTIKIVDDGKKYTFRKDELYGFRDRNNDVYRFYNNMEYRIAEAGDIYIYVQKEHTTENKNNKVEDVYYFSATASREIIPLTLANLKKAYQGNDKIQNLLDQFFDRDNVCSYDDVHKMYKVNYVFLSNKQ